MAYQVKEFQDIKNDFIDSLKRRVALSKEINNIDDFNVGSVISLIGDGIADVVEDFYFNLFQAVKEGLEQIYNSFYFYRQSGKKAFCNLTIYIDHPIEEKETLRTGSGKDDVKYFDIPVGTKINSSDGTVSFEIIDPFSVDVIQSVGQLDNQEFLGKCKYNCIAICTSEGPQGNVGAKTLSSLDSVGIVNSLGLTVVIENDAASGGSYAESEEEMKKRFQKYLLSLRRGTKESIEYGILTNPGLRNIKYYVNEYRPMVVFKKLPKKYVIDELSLSYNEEVFERNYSMDNKLEPRYTLIRANEFYRDQNGYGDTEENYATIYIGHYKKFNDFLILVNKNIDKYLIKDVQYFDTYANDWASVDSCDISNKKTGDGITDGEMFFGDSYFNFVLDEKKWGRKQIENYDYYFIRLKIKIGSDTKIGEDLDIAKILTYPYPGYVNIFGLKNNTEKLTDFDKLLIEEAIEDYKSAGVSVAIESAEVKNVYPTIVLYVPKETRSQLPVDITTQIKNGITKISNDIGIADSFDRSILVSELNKRFSSYGSIFLYIGYDMTKRERENYTDQIFESLVSQKFDLLNNSVFIIDSLNKINMVSEGSVEKFATSDYSDEEQVGDFRLFMEDNGTTHNPFVFDIIY